MCKGLAGVVCGMVVFLVIGARSEPPQRLDPAAWGSDHVGKALPRFMTGDECLFCHRKDVGATWDDNRHNLTVRLAEPDLAPMELLAGSPTTKPFVAEVTYLLGGNRHQRFLKKSKAFGKFDILSVAWDGQADEAKLVHTTNPQWDTKTFANACVGCHASGVDAKEHTFSAISLECYTCHGDVPVEHTEQPKLVHLSTKRQDKAATMTSICASCHVRTGKSKSSGLPYPNNFVAGDNLFRDFQVDLSDKAIASQNPADAHVLANVRDVVVLGKQGVTCLTCHDVHGQSSKQHHRVANGELCLHCHNADGPKRTLRQYSVHSKTCGY